MFIVSGPANRERSADAEPANLLPGLESRGRGQSGQPQLQSQARAAPHQPVAAPRHLPGGSVPPRLLLLRQDLSHPATGERACV